MKVSPFTFKYNSAKSKEDINNIETAEKKSFQTGDSVSFAALSDNSTKIVEVHSPNNKNTASKLSLLKDFAMESLNTAVDLTRFFITTYGCIALETLRTPAHPSNTSENNNANILKSNLKTDELSAMTDSFAYAVQGLKQEFRDRNLLHSLETQSDSQSVSAAMPIALASLPYQPVDSRL